MGLVYHKQGRSRRVLEWGRISTDTHGTFHSLLYWIDVGTANYF